MAIPRFTRLKTRSGGFVFTAGRGVSVAWQIALTAVVARVLSPTDLGRFTVAFAVANLVGMFCGLSIRRLAMQREVGEQLSDLKIAVALAGLAGVIISGVGCAVVFGQRAGVLAAEIAIWRAADAYAEIGQGVLCLDRRLDRAGIWCAARTTASGITAVGLLFSLDVTVAFAASAVVRVAVVLFETHLPAPQALMPVAWKRLGDVAASGLYISLVNAVILLVDTGPTLGVARFAGLADASMLAPLGRIRFGLTIAASTLGEIVYADMVRRSGNPREVLRTALRPVRLFLALAVALAVLFVSGGARVLFGSVLENQQQLVFLAVAAGTAMGVSTIISSGLTAQGRIGIQLVGFAIAALLAAAGTWLGHWRLHQMYVAQVVGSGLSLLVFLLSGYGLMPAFRRQTRNTTDSTYSSSDGSLSLPTVERSTS